MLINPHPSPFPHAKGSATLMLAIYHPVPCIKVKVKALKTDQVVSEAVIPSFPKVTLSQ